MEPLTTSDPSLPLPTPRRALHTRIVKSEGFLRDDGLWEVDGELIDRKSYAYQDLERGLLSVGYPVHHMHARLTLNHDMQVVEAYATMQANPFAYCLGALKGVDGLKGAHVGSGWRRSVNDAMGETNGCAHIRELFLAMATTAFQTISCYRDQYMKELGSPRAAGSDMPFFLDNCHSWERSSQVVATHFPKFHLKR
ncbi:DUF2889 domain-containing protein [Rhodoferax sp.]|uniref:DUF2889 domain-containing protein n=1 Tax=Rhodoferax sp. TaxID=50421 RepID=UPI0026262FE8|nr:DUF2889 domain-containing protein [Rhodoferax sp.]MDD3937601.1 DUF2889 domain-containing protein [Rhodoferax sp.]